MNKELFEALRDLEKEKGISMDYMLGKIEAALQSAFKREYGELTSLKVVLNKEKQNIRVYKLYTVVEEVTDPKTEIALADAVKISKKYDIGSVVTEEIKPKNFGRLSALSAKSVIIQAIREAEKSNIIREYEKRKEEVITAVVTKRNDNTGDVEVDTGTSTAWLNAADQILGETLHVGDRVRVFITEVKGEAEYGSPVTLSRTHPNMIKRMFEMDIPEIADGTIVIKNVAREAGSRTKIAVFSRDPEVDAVGACIGNKGMRINAIVDELHGEKIDVICFSENMEEYIAAALSPATVLEVEFDGSRNSKVTVASDQLSLAIGKEGQNVRLAAKLTGCKIDIKGVKA